VSYSAQKCGTIKSSLEAKRREIGAQSRPKLEFKELSKLNGHSARC